MINSGVKPKIKGNAVLTALLFLFLTFPAQAFFCVNDTIILDGDIISIQKRERKVNLDSLEKAGNEDVLKNKKPIRGSFGASLGLVSPFFRNNAELENFLSLQKFTNQKEPVSIGPAFGINAAVDISDNITIKVAGTYSSIYLRSFEVNEAQIASDETRTNFENRGGELWQRAVVFIDPGFEERFSKIDVNTTRHQIIFFDIDVNLRYVPKPVKEGWTGWVEFGFSPRLAISEAPELEQYFFNASGDWDKQTIATSNFKKSWLFLNVSGGVGYKLKNGQCLEIILGYKGLPQQLYSTPTSASSLSNAFLMLGWSKAFYFRK